MTGKAFSDVHWLRSQCIPETLNRCDGARRILCLCAVYFQLIYIYIELKKEKMKQFSDAESAQSSRAAFMNTCRWE
jgi:hypothetical protein